MIGTWGQAFGLDALWISNLLLSAQMTVAGGLPAFEAGGEMDFGRNCFVEDVVKGGLKRNPQVKCKNKTNKKTRRMVGGRRRHHEY